MPAYYDNPGINDNSMCYENSHDWSIYKTTTLLSESDHVNDEAELFGQNDTDFNNIYEMPPTIVKTEPITEVLSSDMHYGDWQTKYIDHWSSQDCLYWLIHELQGLEIGKNLPEVRIERIMNVDGVTLKHMTVDDFSRMFSPYGVELFNRLQRFKAPFMCHSYYSFDQWSNNTALRADEPFPSYPSPVQEPHTLTDLDSEVHPFSSCSLPPYCSSSSEVKFVVPEGESGYKSESDSETTVEPPPPPEKRRPGRPRGTRKKKKPEKLGRLWEFIRDLLLNPMYNPSLICWENYEEGTFRFVHSDRVAKLWGSKKDNIDMNYEKLSRAMRYYYKSKVLQPVYGKRLVYKFGPTAKGWRSERPIFRQA